ncbi:hypothetical protein [Streptomyces nigra]|uniref:hypothetical protein n=1 Tax=Streptomyces nigra TaxID=1827580 RepID=UPI003F4DC910
MEQAAVLSDVSLGVAFGGLTVCDDGAAAEESAAGGAGGCGTALSSCSASAFSRAG